MLQPESIHPCATVEGTLNFCMKQRAFVAFLDGGFVSVTIPGMQAVVSPVSSEELRDGDFTSTLVRAAREAYDNQQEMWRLTRGST